MKIPATPESRRRGQLASAASRRTGVRPALPSDLPIAGPPQNLDEANRMLAWAAYALATGKIDPVTARGVAGLCNALVKAIKADNEAKLAALADAVRRLQEQDAEARRADRS